MSKAGGSSIQFKTWQVFLFLLAIALFIRFPFFFRDYIDRDESTFILVAQAWVDGYLPYTKLWDVKPPINFLFFALIIKVFGKSFMAIRFFGSLAVVISSYFVYASCRVFQVPFKLAVFFGVLSVFLQSMFGSIQGVMSEHLTMACFMTGLYLLLKRHSYRNLLFAGIAMGCALMIKLNIAYAVLFCGLHLCYFTYVRFGLIKAGMRVFLFGIAAVVVIILTLLPYWFSGQEQLWWDSIIRAPLAYSEARRASLPSMLTLPLLFLGMVWWGSSRKWVFLTRRKDLLIILSIAGILISFVKGGRINSHYLIQLYPPLLIFIGMFTVRANIRFKPVYKRLIIILLFLLPVETYNEYFQVLKYKIDRNSFYNGEGFSVPDYIKKNGIPTDRILFLGYHIGYWNLNIYPPVKSATHPSNIVKAEMFPFYNPDRKSGLEEVKYIMENIRPPTVVTRKNRDIFDEDEIEENRYIEQYLERNYRIHGEVDQAVIYVRSEFK